MPDPDGGSGGGQFAVAVGAQGGGPIRGGLQGGSGEQYFVGTFDGTLFTNDNPSSTTLWTDYGKDCYCALTFNGMLPGQLPVMIGWMSNWHMPPRCPPRPGGDR